MSYLYKATKAYQEQLRRDARSGEVGGEIEPRQPRVDATHLLETLLALTQASEAREGESAPPAWMQT